MKIINTNGKEIKEIPLPTLGGEGKVLVPEKLGRPEGKKLNRLEKEIIAVHSNLGADQVKLAEVMGTSQAEVSIIKRGYHQTNLDTRKKDEEIDLIGKQAKHKIVDIATTKLLDTLNLFTPGAIEQKELPGAAQKLASVAEKLTNNGRAEGGNNINFIVYQPRARSEEDFGEPLVLNER